MSDIRLDEYDFDLPPDRIAQAPAPRREDSRLLVLDRASERLEAALFGEIGRFLRPGDLLVLNDTRVFPARLRGRRPTGARVEVLLLASLPGDPRRWEALIRPARAGRSGGEILIDGSSARARALAEEESGRFRIEFVRDGKVLDRDEVLGLCEVVGEMPLPPYIERRPGDPRAALDRERYQTVYARTAGAVAAPTAGLHFTPELLDALRLGGVEIATVTLAVGLGTFRPVRDEDLRAGRLHREAVSIGREGAERILAARREGRRIVAVGTTSARALESWALAGSPAAPGDGPAWAAPTEILIAPGFRFSLVDALVTNFHLPRSSLLLLVSAMAGRERILAAYRRAIEEGFRFYSYGNAMLIL